MPIARPASRCRLALAALLLFAACDRDATSSGTFPAELELSLTAIQMEAGDTARLTARALDGRGDELPALPASAALEWRSSDTSVVRVDGGLITAVGPGRADVAASVGEVTAAAEVTVRVTPAGLLIVRGDSQTAVGGWQMPDSLVVRVVSAHGRGVAGVEVEFAVASGGGTLSPMKVTSDAEGLARSAWTPGTPLRSQRVEARVAGKDIEAVAFTSPMTFSVDRLSADTVAFTPFPPYRVDLAISVGGDEGVRQVTYSVDGGVEEVEKPSKTLPLPGFPPPVYYISAAVPLGAHTIRVTATDSAGNVNRWHRGVTVRELPTRDYQLRLLGGLGGTDGAALDVNEKGEVVGWALRAEGDTAAVLWGAAGPVDLGAGLGAWSKATGIANTGEVVGVFGDGSCRRSFGWKDGDRTLVEGCGFSAEDVNDRGTVAFRGAKLLRDGLLIDLPTITGRPTNAGAPVRLNGDDAVMALHYPPGGGCGGGHCAYGPMTIRPPYSSPADVTVRQYGGFGYDINDRGDVTATCSGGSGQGSCGGIIYLAGGPNVRIDWPTTDGSLVASTSGRARAINDLRQAVGTVQSRDPATRFAYLWEDGTVYRVVVGGEWVLDEVMEINDRGQIVGHARNAGTGQKGAVLLTPVQ